MATAAVAPPKQRRIESYFPTVSFHFIGLAPTNEWAVGEDGNRHKIYKDKFGRRIIFDRDSYGFRSVWVDK